MDEWTERKILILGMTYPAYSRKYAENVCTGGLVEGSLDMIRLHPFYLRYLPEEKRPKAFQWISVKTKKHAGDPRPESFRVQPDSIKLLDYIPATEATTRRNILEQSPYFYNSLEDLQERQSQTGMSLGIIRPAAVLDCAIKQRSAAERKEWLAKQKEILAQEHLFDQRIKPLDFPEARFHITWRCDSPSCPTHTMGLLQWGIHELYRKYRQQPQKVIDKMWSTLDTKSKDIFLFVGSFRGHQQTFGLMDSYSAPRMAQPRLFAL